MIAPPRPNLALLVACPECRAAIGEPCVRMSRRLNAHQARWRQTMGTAMILHVEICRDGVWKPITPYGHRGELAMPKVAVDDEGGITVGWLVGHLAPPWRISCEDEKNASVLFERTR